MGFFSWLFGGKKDSVEEVTSKTKGMVTANLLNARKKPNPGAKVLYQLKKNTIVTVVSSEKKDKWYKIYTQLGFAYCMKDFIQIKENIEKVAVAAKVLNVRSYNSTDSTVIGKVYKGSVLIVLSKHDGWYGVDFNGQKGFVSADYVTPLDQLDETKPDKKTTTTDTKKTDNTKKTEERVFFNARKDLAKVELAPSKKLSDEGQDRYGKIAVKTWNNYGNLISVISKELGIDVEIALAVICVESGGSGFSSDGKMIIRFENHVFYTYFGAKSEDDKKRYEEHFTFDTKNRRDGHKYRANKSDEWKTSHNGQASEWESLEIARQLSDTQALYSISMGAPQVMGFNYKSIGYSSVQEMFDAFSKDIRYHIMALFDFCTAKSTRVQYLLTGDFLSFAKEYNGLTAPEAYQKRLEQYYEIYKKILK
jgi:hypothetical protein